MKIKNITSKVQTLWIINLLRGESFQVQVLPTEPREISREHIPDMSKNVDFDKKFEILGESLFAKNVKIKEEEEVSSESPEDISVEENDIKEDSETKNDNVDSFICDVCGAEFASARGLATHKHKSHESN